MGSQPYATQDTYILGHRRHHQLSESFHPFSPKTLVSSYPTLAYISVKQQPHNLSPEYDLDDNVRS